MPDVSGSACKRDLRITTYPQPHEGFDLQKPSETLRKDDYISLKISGHLIRELRKRGVEV